MRPIIFSLSVLVLLGAWKKEPTAPDDKPFVVSNVVWEQTSLDSVDVRCFAVSGKNLFAGTEGGVFLSTNNGTSWNQVKSGYTRSLAVSGTNLFAHTDSLYLSTDNGTSWTAVNQLDPFIDCLFALDGTNLLAGFYYATSTGPPGPNPTVCQSTDAGTTWTVVLKDHDTFDFAVSGTNIFAGTIGGVFLSNNNGTSWTNVGLDTLRVHALAVSPASGGSGTNIFAGTSTGAFKGTMQ